MYVCAPPLGDCDKARALAVTKVTARIPMETFPLVVVDDSGVGGLGLAGRLRGKALEGRPRLGFPKASREEGLGFGEAAQGERFVRGLVRGGGVVGGG